MRKRTWLVWFGVAISLLAFLLFAACIPVYSAWKDRSDISGSGFLPEGAVQVRYSWIMQNAEFLYRPLMRLNARLHGYKYHAAEFRNANRVIMDEFYCPREMTDPQ